VLKISSTINKRKTAKLKLSSFSTKKTNKDIKEVYIIINIKEKDDTELMNILDTPLTLKIKLIIKVKLEPSFKRPTIDPSNLLEFVDLTASNTKLKALAKKIKAEKPFKRPTTDAFNPLEFVDLGSPTYVRATTIAKKRYEKAI